MTSIRSIGRDLTVRDNPDRMDDQSPTDADTSIDDIHALAIDVVELSCTELPDLPMMDYRMSLIASIEKSEKRDGYWLYIASHSAIRVYSLSLTGSLASSLPVTVLAPTRSDINRIQCGWYGEDPVLMIVDMSGQLIVYFCNDVTCAPIIVTNTVPNVDDLSAWSLSITPRGSLTPMIAVGSNAHRVFVWTLHNSGGSPQCSMDEAPHSNNIPCLSFDSTGTLLATASIDGRVRTFTVDDDTNTVRCAHSAVPSHEWGWSVQWFPRAYVSQHSLTFHQHQQSLRHATNADTSTSTVQPFRFADYAVEIRQYVDRLFQLHRRIRGLEAEAEEHVDEAQLVMLHDRLRDELDQRPEVFDDDDNDEAFEDGEALANGEDAEADSGLDDDVAAIADGHFDPNEIIDDDDDENNQGDDNIDSDEGEAKWDHESLERVEPALPLAITTAALSSPFLPNKHHHRTPTSKDTDSDSETRALHCHGAIPADLLIYCTKSSVAVLDSELQLLDKITHVCPNILPRYRGIDRLSFVEVIPQVSLVIVGSSASDRITVLRLVEFQCGKLKLVWECSLGVERRHPIVGMTVMRRCQCSSDVVHYGVTGCQCADVACVASGACCWIVQLLYRDSRLVAYQLTETPSVTGAKAKFALAEMAAI